MTMYFVNYIFVLVILFNILKLYSNSDCSKVCRRNKNCLRMCKNPLNFKITSNISLKHCGLSYFGNSIDSKIINGKIADNHLYPWMVSILDDPEQKEDYHICGGAIITNNFILTAAHCVAERYLHSDHWVMMGSNSLSPGEEKPIILNVGSQIQVHENYNRATLENDIALIKTVDPINITTTHDRFIINSICLPQKNFSAKGIAKLSGWGDTDYSSETPSRLLREANYFIVDDRNKCNKIFRESVQWTSTNGKKYKEIDVGNNRLCFMGSQPPINREVKYSNTVFKGDSGSHYYQVYDHRAHTLGFAIISREEKWNNPTSVGIKVSMYIDWIIAIMKYMNE